jgi:hypothetical protein
MICDVIVFYVAKIEILSRLKTYRPHLIAILINISMIVERLYHYRGCDLKPCCQILNLMFFQCIYNIRITTHQRYE